MEDPNGVEPARIAAREANARGMPTLLDFRIAKQDYPPQFAAFHKEIFALGLQAPG